MESSSTNSSCDHHVPLPLHSAPSPCLLFTVGPCGPSCLLRLRAWVSLLAPQSCREDCRRKEGQGLRGEGRQGEDLEPEDGGGGTDQFRTWLSSCQWAQMPAWDC
eukprot:333000-Rhodomonas_salina.1